MLLVILGAGASYDSAPSRHPGERHQQSLDNRPPIANDLFHDRYLGLIQKYPHIIDIVPRLRDLPENESIEDRLQTLEDEAKDYPEGLNQLASIRYYLQEMLYHYCNSWLDGCGQVTNHRTLIDYIKRWRKESEPVCFVTFNYDTLMETALTCTGFPITSLPSYVSGEFTLIKLHGSINWGRIVRTELEPAILSDRERMQRELIKRVGSVEISDQYVLQNEPPPLYANGSWAIFPAVAIPVRAKEKFECPPDHVDRLTSLLPSVKKILIIGWRAMEKHFIDLLRKGLANVHPHVFIVNKSQEEGEKAAANIRTAFAANYTIYPGGFSDFIRHNAGENFFKP